MEDYKSIFLFPFLSYTNLISSLSINWRWSRLSGSEHTRCYEVV